MGKVLEHDGERVAAYRDAAGNLTRCSAVCPHLGCIVAWNEAEQTWDCPCHGSRFHPTGELLAGPAEKGLEPLS
jgi:Rieske Fe-S protein